MNIIAVDDEQASLSLINKAIQKAMPSEIPTCFESVEKALIYAKQFPIDVAFLDIEMGEYSGLVLAKALCKIKPDTNIIFVTGYAQYMDEAFDLYASGYVRKPPRVERIRRELENLRHKLTDSSAIALPDSVGAFSFDHAAGRVYRNGKDVLLKPKEYKIFIFLAANPGIYYTPQELFSKTSGLEPNDDLRSLYVHMSGLRKKLGLDDAGTEKSIEIEQQRGKGYRLTVAQMIKI